MSDWRGSRSADLERSAAHSRCPVNQKPRVGRGLPGARGSSLASIPTSLSSVAGSLPGPSGLGACAHLSPFHLLPTFPPVLPPVHRGRPALSPYEGWPLPCTRRSSHTRHGSSVHDRPPGAPIMGLVPRSCVHSAARTFGSRVSGALTQRLSQGRGASRDSDFLGDQEMGPRRWQSVHTSP